jgi:2,3-bisphosphoglycerate-dependent phosphoglycerate mutase
VILVRHAMPELDPAVPHHDWHLGEAGRAAARELAAHLSRDARVVSSDEPKARETAEELGLPVRLDARLREVSRPAVWRDDYRALARRYVGGESLPGWEPHDAVIARFRAAATADIVVTHGLAMTLFLGQDAAFWEELRFPDAWRVSPPGRIPARRT